MTFQKSDAIKSLPFYSSLTADEIENVLQNSEIKLFKKGETITGLESRCLGPFLILEGEARAVIEDENLREVTLYKLYPDEMGLLSAACVLEHITFDAKFEVEKDSVFLVLKSCAIKKLMEKNLNVKCLIFETLTDRFSACMETMRDLLFTKYDRRMASFLVERYIYTEQKEFNITQEEIAKMTSSVREVAGKTIRKFAEEGILEYGRGKIKILDLQKLKDKM